ncbi:hypothetical protein CMV30_03015 [Nibricoccus aquaticus]|uniref:Uncharacterized protein n=1 Tax=Nibricoccus aquaticus TaxID=2576891 RepID=A0A290Q9V4_9BACT|nr:hypothetical protein CMV30_03015 [Nibricoccus aquaticus]
MKKRRIIMAVTALAVVCVCAFAWKWNAPDWAFVRQVTGFHFPTGTKYLAQFDNAEWFVVSVVELPSGQIPAFANAHRFSLGDPKSIDTARSLPPKYRSIPVRPDILTADAQTEYQSWTAILDPQTRLLWIQIIYPDWSGDHSGTAPQPRQKKEPNQTLQPTPTSVTPRADARVAPSNAVPHLKRSA